jgi:hypothetical protein
MASLWLAFRCQATAPPVQKVSHWRGEIARLASRSRHNGEQDFRHGNQTGGNHVMIAEYLATTALMQET